MLNVGEQLFSKNVELLTSSSSSLMKSAKLRYFGNVILMREVNENETNVNNMKQALLCIIILGYYKHMDKQHSQFI